MAESYFEAVRQGLIGALELLVRLALPLGILLGLGLIAAVLAVKVNGQKTDGEAVRAIATRVFSAVGLGLLMLCLWSGLREAQPLARDAIAWKDSAEATANPAPEAPPIDQFGPVFARMVEHTYTRSLTLPPDFLQRIGSDSVAALAPYLTDPTAQNVSRLVDSFKRSGEDVLFTRELTRLDEQPMSFDSSDIKVSIHRLQEQAYDADFKGIYVFSNPTSEKIHARFLVDLPQGGGTVQGLKITVGQQTITEPDDRGYYTWQGDLAPSETKQAVVEYKSIGKSTWSYDLGSNRRRVRSFNLEATVDGPVEFEKGGILPSSRSGGKTVWHLTDVVTSQKLALSFPPSVAARDAYLQAISLLPATLVLLAGAMILAGWRQGSPLSPGQIAMGLTGFAFGATVMVVLANYASSGVAVIAGSGVALVLVLGVTRVRLLPVVLPVVLLPAAALSPTHTGLWVLLLGAVGLGGFWLLPKLNRSPQKAA